MLGVIELVVFVSWALMFAVLFGMLICVTVLRGRRLRRRRAAPPVAYGRPASYGDPYLPARLAEARHADPYLDVQLLLDAAQMACMVMFAAMSTGDEQAMRRLAAPSFWRTFFGRYVRSSARAARMQRIMDAGRGRASRRHARLPVDYQASAPELIGLELGPQQCARVRVSFSQLRVVVAPGAAGQTAMASATSLTSLAISFGGAMGQQMNNSASGLPWLALAGRYDLAFTRPAGARTDPRAALTSRNCTACGATYQSELAIVCAHCRTDRPMLWGTWRLAGITAVE